MVREPIKASIKKLVDVRVKKKHGRLVCEKCKSKPRGVTLQYHHKNMKNYDNTSSNIMLVCPNCHTILHNKVKTHIHRDLFGNKTRVTRVRKKKIIPKVKKQKVGETVVKKLKDSSGKLRSYNVKKIATGKYKKTLVKPKKKPAKKKRSSNSFFKW